MERREVPRVYLRSDKRGVNKDGVGHRRGWQHQVPAVESPTVRW